MSKCINNNQTNIRTVGLKDSKVSRLDLKEKARAIFEAMNALLPSTYTDESASSLYNQHLKCLAEEFAKNQQLLDLLERNLNLETADKEYLWQNFGQALDFAPSADITAEEYRQLLIALVFVILNGAKVHVYQEALERFTVYPVKIFEVFDLLDSLDRGARVSVLNSFGDLLNTASGECDDPLILNSADTLNDSFLFDRKRSLIVFDILINDAPNPIFPDKGGKLTEILEKTKSSETCVLLRNVLLDTFSVSEYIVDGPVTIQIGEIVQVSGTGWNIPENTLNAPNPLPFVWNLAAEFQFVADEIHTIL